MLLYNLNEECSYRKSSIFYLTEAILSSISTGYRGFSEEPISKEQLLTLFDELWGEGARELPRYPKVIGGINAIWRSKDGIEHNVSNISEIIDAYEKYLTYDICIRGKINDNPRCELIYVPAKKEAIFQITAPTEEIASCYINYVKEMFPKENPPIVFISYAREELALADFVKKILTRLSAGKLEIFVATRDIPSGDNPLKVMMEDKLKSAQAIIPICSHQAKSSPWVWWESAAVWGIGHKIHPLCTNISLGDFGAPLSLVAQGRNFFDKDEFIDALNQVCNQLSISCSGKLDSGEISELEKLKKEYTKEQTSAEIEIGYKTIEQKSELHRYSLLFEIKNRTTKAFEDIIAILYFPINYVERAEWHYDYLKSSPAPDKKGYLSLTFMFSGLEEVAKKRLKTSLLPGKKLTIFGERGLSSFYYQIDDNRWDERFNYEVQWEVYVNGGPPQEGSIPFSSLQNF